MKPMDVEDSAGKVIRIGSRAQVLGGRIITVTGIAHEVYLADQCHVLDPDEDGDRPGPSAKGTDGKTVIWGN